ncbi:Hypothetical predicted protein [Pelobates cultripes]|uniref:Uncharacterized protein n=1 Tax=Pelobates cultripes TaxID=61616 RepID=A0AAD1TJ24_PELCU|nr:Hypothetical predicted protein [Pelobates cultripes]
MQSRPSNETTLIGELGTKMVDAMSAEDGEKEYSSLKLMPDSTDLQYQLAKRRGHNEPALTPRKRQATL